MTAPTVLATDRLELGEGIRWTGDRAVLTDILTGRLLAVPADPAAPLALITRLPCPLGAVAPIEGRQGHWIAAAGTGICRIDPLGGVDWIARPEDDAPVRMRMNDGVADPHGRFWAGSMAYDTTEDAGSLYRLDRDGRVTRVLQGITIPNGPAFTADGTVMYLADSARGVIHRCQVDPVTGDPGTPEPFVTLASGSPDGMTTDAEGGLWTAVWGTGQVHRYRPDGGLDRIVQLPAGQPAGLCLGGPDGRTLLVTSAHIGLTDPGPLDGAVLALRVDVPGTPAAAYRPADPAPADRRAEPRKAPMDTPRPLRPGPVVCVGETMAALAPDPLSPLDDADLLRIDIAGAESNVALYLADHGIPARWVSAVGDDPFGRRIRERISAGGVDVSGVRTDPVRPTGLLLKDPGTHGTRVHYHRRGSAASALTPEVLDDPAVAEAALLHFSGITPALSPGCHELVERALRPDRPWPVSFDVNYRPALWSGRSAADVLWSLAERADIVLVGLDEAQALWGEGLGDARAVRDLLPGPQILVVKDGAHAATAFAGTEIHSVPALTVRVTEPVGAGDAFAAGFLSGLLRGMPVGRALRLGHLTAASALRVSADRGPLPAPEVVASLLDAEQDVWRAAAFG